MATNRQRAGIGGAIALIIAAVFAVEGGYVNNPADPGGETNHGVTVQVARESGYRGRMRDLTREAAEDIYRRRYIAGPGYEGVVALDRHVAEELVDSGVNAGPGRASRWFQETLNHLNRQGADYPDIAEDGAVGPRTLAAYASLQRVRGAVLACELTIKLLDAKQAQHYMQLGGRNSRFETFMIGWVRTRIDNVGPEACADRRPVE